MQSTWTRFQGFLLAVPFAGWIVLFALGGGAAGLGGLTFTYASGFSYLSDDPAACANCHVMRDVYDGWNHGSHKAVATCNDCHTPHDFVRHWLIKGLDGWKHSSAFTTGNFHEPIRITEFDKGIAYENCLRCHGEMTDLMSHRASADPTDCLHCHVGTGHGKMD